jgi:hypothetical protein
MRWSSPDLSNEAQYICGRDSLLLVAQEVDCDGMEGCPVPIWASIFVPIILGIVIPFWGVLLAPPLLGPDGFVLYFGSMRNGLTGV